MSVAIILLIMAMDAQNVANSNTKALLATTTQQYKANIAKLSSAEDEIAALKKSLAQSDPKLQELSLQLAESKRISENLRNDVTSLTKKEQELEAQVAKYEATYGKVYIGRDPEYRINATISNGVT